MLVVLPDLLHLFLRKVYVELKAGPVEVVKVHEARVFEIASEQGPIDILPLVRQFNSDDLLQFVECLLLKLVAEHGPMAFH